jgi:hypothetical protein
LANAQSGPNPDFSAEFKVPATNSMQIFIDAGFIALARATAWEARRPARHRRREPPEIGRQNGCQPLACW